MCMRWPCNRMGKLIGGDFTRYNGDFAASNFIARLNTDGTLDTSFNTGGAGADSGVAAVAVQANGKIIIGGYFPSYNGAAAASDYMPDSTRTAARHDVQYWRSGGG